MVLPDTDRIRFVVAFYGIKSKPNGLEELYSISLRWFSDLRLSPNQLGVGRKGRESGRMGSFERTHAVLAKRGFADVHGFDINCGLPDASVPGIEFYASITVNCIVAGSYCVIAVPNQADSQRRWVPYVREIADKICPSYGIGFRRELESGPVWYALGVNLGDGIGWSQERLSEARNISRWSNIGMGRQVYRDGLLRDVYPFNFLSKDQLSRPVGSLPLESWIRENERHGKLTPLTKEMLLWEVDETQVATVRQALHDAEAIFDWRMFIKRK